MHTLGSQDAEVSGRGEVIDDLAHIPDSVFHRVAEITGDYNSARRAVKAFMLGMKEAEAE